MQPGDQFLNANQILKNGPQVLKLVAECVKAADSRRVNPVIEPGFLRKQLPAEPPRSGCTLEEIIKDTQEKYLPGVVLWQSPKFFAYYPSHVSELALYAELVSAAVTSPGFSYAASPSHTELQNIVMDWSVKALGLPSKFEFKNSGGGVILGSMSEGVYLTVHAAKDRKLKEMNIAPTDPRVLKLAAYVPDTAHVATLRGMMLKDINYCRRLACVYDQEAGNFVVDLAKFEQVLQKDIEQGLIPFFCSASIGTTFSAAIDQIEQIGKICKKYGMWFNVDAAYLGSTWLHQPFRNTQKGVQNADSLQLNFSKPMFAGSGGSLLYIANKQQFGRSLNLTGDFSILKNKYTDECDVVDYKDWQVGLNRKNNALKFFYNYKYYGLDKLTQSVVSRAQLAQYLAGLVKDSQHFELFSKPQFGLVCINLKGKPETKYKLTKKLSPLIKDLQEGYLSCADFREYSIIRIVVGNPNTTKQHIDDYWVAMNKVTEKFLAENSV